MTTRKTHFQQIPVELVKKIAQELPRTENHATHAVKNETRNDFRVPINGPINHPINDPVEQWRDVAEKVQREQDPKKMIALVDQLIAKLDEERSPANRAASTTRSSRDLSSAQ
jgi:hypothetical protein